MPPKTAAVRTGSASTAVVVMCLYVTSGGPNSIRAIANLKTICTKFLHGNFKLEIVDVLEKPRRAMADGILVTPCVIKLAPLPGAKIVGNLSDRAGVLRALGIGA